jgi:hypothetical protein
MTKVEYELMECIEQAQNALIAAAISKVNDALEEIDCDAWQRFRSEAK